MKFKTKAKLKEDHMDLCGVKGLTNLVYDTKFWK